MTIVIGEVTAAGDERRTQLPKRIDRLLAAAAVTVPARGPIPIHEVDRAFEGIESVSERLYLKSVLRERGYLA
jgi:hypothetical protein